ncbi:hypothetical protein KDA_28660 [Dictyobacter alpinus]|uniref:Peptidase S11 D-alanyl-D-alanine carboxypeptidase A N-terminal domain-containing protein n=1 Tax=Dictyobacter alpinus TaxID=2014873 RepID=A0A402B7U0_9CHLR|nr:D-alanyl-D-alanine carboxypeptidase family protein [Dictyobacter alpinus]GCE27382.1 hypothetical protein KDA_28660 [Dictyobacter alpinus]
MRRTPSQEDQQFEEENTRTPSRRRRVLDEDEENQLADHPEIPKIRRASRYQDPVAPSARRRQSPQSAQRARLERPQTDMSVDEDQLMRRRAQLRKEQRAKGEDTTLRRPAPRKAPVKRGQTTVRKPKVYIDNTYDKAPDEEFEEPHPRVQQTTTLRKPRPRRPVAAYHVPTIQESHKRIERRERRTQHALFDRFQYFLQNRPLLVTIGGILAAILILPLLISSLIRTPQTTVGHFPNPVIGQPGTHETPIPVDPNKIVVTPPNNGHPAPPVLASSAYLLDADTGKTLYAANPTTRIPMMSTTKLMTALLTVEKGNLDRSVTINTSMSRDLNELSADSSVMGIKPGETYTIRELMYGLMLVSGNDAAIIIADADAGSVPRFVDQMNQRAQQLGLRDTHFRNPHGLMEDGHYSSAHDLAILGEHAFNNSQIQQISATKEYHVTATRQHAEHFLQNGNQFMYWYPGVNGGKTGWDAAANFLQVISCTRNNHHLIGVVMHTVDWWTDMRDLMNWGFNTFTWISPREINANVHAIPWAAEWTYFHSDTRERTIPMGTNGRYYVYTQYGIAGPIMSYFDKNQGLKKFGYPISEVTTASTTTISQRFERATIQCDVKSQQCKTA